VTGWVSSFVGAVVEAWDELRIHRGRVLLSLIGVGVAVAALTSVVGLGAIAQQAQTEQLERGSGRPATLVLSTPFDPVSGESADQAVLDAAVAKAVERYSIAYWGSVGYSQLTVQFRDGVDYVETQTVSPSYGAMHRVQLAEGAWFTEWDARRLAPAVIISDAMYQRLGAPDLATHPTVSLTTEGEVTAVIIGVMPPSPFETSLRMYILTSAFTAISSPAVVEQLYPIYEFWIPVDAADEVTALLQREVTGALGEGWQVDVTRQDYLAWEGGGDPLGPIRIVLAGIAVLILGLGALGLVNISLVTVRQRIQEIGIRRSFGATAPRVFFAVMMESVVATAVAGVVGVAIAIAIVQSPWVREQVAPGLLDVPPFPLEAAVLGIGAATIVGALAGLLPALVAVRVKVIDAIRY
jgi:putative ABC transport system permease protein